MGDKHILNHANGLILVKGKHITEANLKAASKKNKDKLVSGVTLKNGAEDGCAEAKKCLAHYEQFIDSKGNHPSGQKNWSDAIEYVASKYAGDTGSEVEGADGEDGKTGEASGSESDDDDNKKLNLGLLVFTVFGPGALNSSHLLNLRHEREAGDGRTALRKVEAQEAAAAKDERTGGCSSSASRETTDTTSKHLGSIASIQTASLVAQSEVSAMRNLAAKQLQLSQQLAAERGLMETNMKALSIFEKDSEDFHEAKAEWKRNRDRVKELQSQLASLDEEIKGIQEQNVVNSKRLAQAAFTSPPNKRSSASSASSSTSTSPETSGSS